MSQTQKGPRYADLVIGGDTVIYDREDHSAWVQSDFAIEVGPYG